MTIQGEQLRGFNAEQLHGLALQDFLPPERLTIPDFAARHRILANEGGGYVGRWRNEEAPYMVEPAECVTSLDYLTVAVAGPGQCSKTASVGENWLLYSIAADPADLLWYMQTDEAVEAYVKSRINPMIDTHDLLASRRGAKSVDDSLHFKRFAGMRVEFLSATASNLINKSAPRIFADEVDAYPDGLGDVKATLDVRRQTYGDHSMLVMASHPDKARGLKPERDWTGGIMAVYADSDRRLWYWPCPECEKYSSPIPIAPWYMALDYPSEGTLDVVQSEARLVCPHNGCRIKEHHRRWMNSRGKWVALGQDIASDGEVSGERLARKTAGFWIVGVMSPFILGGIGALARARVKAEREYEISGEEQSLREVMVKQWGIPFAPPRSMGTIDANDLADRAETELRLGIVPQGVRFITIAVDVQIAHFEWLARGWGVGAESWIIDRGRISADPSTSKEDWDGLLDLFTRAWPLEGDASRGMTARACGYDSGGAMGVTQQAYLTWLRWRKARGVRLFGKISGRDCWSILPTKGTGTVNAAKLAVVYPDTVRKANVMAGAGHVPVAMFNANLFKDDLAGQLMRGDSGPLFVHFPYALRSAESPHVWFEQATAERPNKKGQWERTAPGQRNEALDLLVMSHVIAHLHGLSRIDWAKPPSWAREWDSNTTIVSLGSDSAAPAITRAGAVAPIAQAAPLSREPVSIDSFIDKFQR